MTELVPDPDFGDAAKWDVSDDPTAADISGGKLTLTDYSGSVYAVGMDAPVIGQEVTYTLVVDSESGGGLISCGGLDYGGGGGIPGYLWGSGIGAGTFTYTDTFSNTNPLRIQNFVSSLTIVISKFSIQTASEALPRSSGGRCRRLGRRWF